MGYPSTNQPRVPYGRAGRAGVRGREAKRVEQCVATLPLVHEEPRPPAISVEAVPDRLRTRHVLDLERQLAIGRPPRAFVESADPAVRQFIDGRADGPLPVW